MEIITRIKNFKLNWIKTSPERRETVVKDVTAGSEPGIRFYLLLSTSALIAAFGLIANSAAVIIGAMLVSPLMTPIIGSALGLVMGDGRLFTNAMRSVVVGTVLAILFSAFLGILPLALEATPEMLSRTKPTLLDLCVAILAGFAGSYAMIDEKVSPALPGVAIAVAIVPPLSNTGICLSLGYYDGAFGSFMLFFANFVSILLVSAATFIAAGLTPQSKLRHDKNFLRSFFIAATGFIVVAGFLTYSLVNIVKDRQLNDAIETALHEEFDKLHSTTVDNYVYDVEDGKLYIMASVRSPVIITPKIVNKLEEDFTREMNMPVRFVVRSILSKDVSADGSSREVFEHHLEGFYFDEHSSPDENKIRLTEQIMLEKLAHWPRMRLMNVELLHVPDKPTVIIATVTGFRELTPKEIRGLEQSVKEIIEEDDIDLVIRTIVTPLSDKDGDLLHSWMYGKGKNSVEEDRIKRADQIVREKFQDYTHIFLINVYERVMKDHMDILVEAVGPVQLTPEQIAGLEQVFSEELNWPVNLDVWHKADAVITSEGYMSYEDYNEENIHELEEILRDRNEKD